MEVNFVNKRKIVYNHIKKIKKARKEKKEGCCGHCIFSIPSGVLTFLLGIERDDIFNSCPLAAYVLLIYGFINSCAYDQALGNLVQKHPIPKKNIEQYFDSLSEKQKNYIITNLQTKYVDCGLGCKQECKVIEANKI